ncbi:MAG: SusD/RagB family nutrient-binding outer membrane lipoprotein [Bacteroidota bacterium]
MKINIYIIGFIFLGLGINSCSHFEDLNTDPTTTVAADPQSLITAVQLSYSGEREVTWRSTAGYHMAFIQMISDNWAIARGQVYQADPQYLEFMWRSSYGKINDLTAAITEAGKDPAKVNYEAVARIFKVLIFSELTDTYGDIPYFDAVKGYDEGVLYPKYDNQQDIYTDFFKELKEAAAQLDPAMPLNGDLIYGGNVEGWKKFANSLRLRLAMRLIHVDNTLAQTEAEAAVADGVFESYTDGAIVYHGNYNVIEGGTVAEIRGNAFSQVQRFAEEIVVGCETYVSYLRDNNDPRFTLMFGMYGAYEADGPTVYDHRSVNETSVEATAEYKAKYGKLQGFPSGHFIWNPIELEDGTEDPDWSWATNTVDVNGKTVQFLRYFKALQLRRELTRLEMPTIYQSYSEVELWLAEMATYGWATGGADAKTHFANAVQASIDEMEEIYKSEAIVVGMDVPAYIDNIWASADAFEVINMQHYVNNFFNGREGFANWRRSGYPLLKPAGHEWSDPALNGLIPRRLAYPNSEINYNSVNIQEHLDDGVNFWGAPVWWDNSIDRGVDPS